jgi:hypothetical protein
MTNFDYCSQCRVSGYTIDNYKYYEFEVLIGDRIYHWSFGDTPTNKVSLIFHEYKIVSQFNYHPANITPANVKEKLKIYLTFL